MRTCTTLEYALLGLIAQKPQSGYSLRRQFAVTPLGHYSDSPGSIYPALARIAQHGLVRPLAESAQNPRKRRRFALARRGKNELRRWLVLPIGRDDVIHRMDELLLRFAFLGNSPGTALARRFLRSFRKEVTSYVQELEEFLRAMPEEERIGRLALEHGIANYRASADWAQRALQRLERRLP